MILIAGLQGSGKTTAAAKLALLLKGQGRKPLLAAADLQRPAAISQLEQLAAASRSSGSRRQVRDGSGVAREACTGDGA